MAGGHSGIYRRATVLLCVQASDHERPVSSTLPPALPPQPPAASFPLSPLPSSAGAKGLVPFRQDAAAKVAPTPENPLGVLPRPPQGLTTLKAPGQESPGPPSSRPRCHLCVQTPMPTRPPHPRAARRLRCPSSRLPGRPDGLPLGSRAEPLASLCGSLSHGPVSPCTGPRLLSAASQCLARCGDLLAHAG